MDKMNLEDKRLYGPVSGIPSIKDVDAIQRLEFLGMMKKYSNDYLLNNKSSLGKYRWIKDAFNQWSRIYEYPYCYDIVEKNIPAGSHILDAGCGVTFFTFFLNQKYKITAVDQDDYGYLYNEINKKQNTVVNFIKSNLQAISCPSDSFDAVYCISVLEHTRNYDAILKEFYRLLKPNGLLIITFDVSLDNNESGLNRDSAVFLINNIDKYFNLTYKADDLYRDLGKNDLYTIGYMEKNGLWDLLPWPKPTMLGTLKNVLLGRTTVSSSNLMFCNITARKV